MSAKHSAIIQDIKKTTESVMLVLRLNISDFQKVLELLKSNSLQTESATHLEISADYPECFEILCEEENLDLFVRWLINSNIQHIKFKQLPLNDICLKNLFLAIR